MKALILCSLALISLAAFVGLVLVGAGFYLLSLVEHHVYWVLGLGAFSVVWYNGVYLLLKRVTAKETFHWKKG